MASSRRSLGGGRVLGSGKNLAPPAPSIPQPAIARQSAIVSPSQSTLSLDSQISSTPTSTDLTEDLTDRVALSHGSAQAVAAASSRLVCPICNEEMMTLLQLNRHIDDNHANLEEIEQDEAKTWFKQQMVKAKNFQPFQLLNSKLRGFDVFESNNDLAASPNAVSSSAATPTRMQSPARMTTASPAPPPLESKPQIQPDDLITRSHWQRPSGADLCADPMCGKRLGPTAGQVNCRHCGKLFCEEHTLYQMKLSRSAKHDPGRGLWYRVCETCYKSREGYNDHNGAERNHFEYFKTTRRKTVDKQYLETSRLETRLTRLTQLLANPPPPEPAQSTGNMLWASLIGDRSHMRNLEQTIVPWEDDASVGSCPFCQQPFSQYSLRRHHCRLCGRVVCGDPTTACSSEVGLHVDIPAEKLAAGKVAIDVRICKDCQRTIFSKADFARELAQMTPDQRAYNNLMQFEQGIRLLLPKFTRLLTTLQDPERPPTSAQLADASKVRKRLTDAFTQYDFAARRIRDMATTSATQQRLQKAIHQRATNFLHVHMLSLKSVPKILRASNGGGALASIRYNEMNGRPSSSRTSSVSSAAVTAIETEERELRERLMVLEEQKFMVSEMIADANRRRKFDEVGSLAQNVDDLSREIDQIQGQLGNIDFKGVYTGDGAVR